jgi:hypothetical protein
VRRRLTRLVLLGALFALVVFAVLASPAAAAEPVITGFEVETPDRLTVGDRFRYVITVEVDAGSTVSVAPAGLPGLLSQADRIATRTRTLADGRSELTLTLEVAAFAPGAHELPALTLRARAPGGATSDFTTPTSFIEVESVLPPEGGVLTPRDLKPQAEVGQGPPTTLYAVLGGLVVALLVVLALIAWRLRRVSTRPALEAVPAVAVVAPEDRARHVLDGAAEMLARRDYAAYYSTLAVTVRTYLTDRFGFPAFALATTELQERMVAEGMDRWQARLVAGLLNQCDAVVFAQYRPATDRADADLTAAYEIVEMSRPEREEVPAL